MKLHLSNLDELIQKVRNVHAKNYLNESIAAYRTGAYRASLITTWIAVCVDIIEKIRELSISEDLAAKKHAERLERISSNDYSAMQSFEKELLNIACNDLQLISMIEKSHLERLKDDRNICAHPTFSDDGSQFNPPAELVLSYIVQAANYLLIHPPMKGKAIVTRIYDAIQESSFPEDEEKAYILLSSENYLGRAKDSAIKNLSIIVIKRIFVDEASIPQELMNRLSASLGAIYRVNSVVYNEAISDKINGLLSSANDGQLKRVFPFFKRRSELWSKINDSEKIRIEALIKSMSLEDFSKYQVTRLAEINLEIRHQVVDRMKLMDLDAQVKLISEYPSIILKDIAIGIFSQSKSFDSAEYRGRNLLLPMSTSFNDDDLRNVLSAALKNNASNGINQILFAGSIEVFFFKPL